MRPHQLVPLLLVALTLAVFFQVREHDFVAHQDIPCILENPSLQQELGPKSIAVAFTTPHVGSWIPLTWISLQIDHALYGFAPAGYHLTNVALHLLGALLLFSALSRMTRQPWPSAFAAAVFAVHPLHVESVAWASERKDALCGLFWMGTLWAYARYAEQPDRVGRYAWVVAGVACALLAKPVAVTLPFALLLLDYWPLGRLHTGPDTARPDPARLRRALLEKLPLLGLALLASGITLLVQAGTGGSHSTDFPVSLRLANGITSAALYLRDAFWPSGLAVFYPFPARGIPPTATLLAGLLLAGVSALALRHAAKRPFLLVGWLWYLLTLAPTLGIIPVGLQARADRYTYIPLIGVALMLAWSGAELARRWRLARPALAIGAATAVAGLAVAAHHQTGIWRDTVTLFEHAVAVTEDNDFAHHRLGAAYHERGEDARAELHYRQALRINPDRPAPQLEYANMLRERGELADAALHFARGLRLDPHDALARKRYGLTLLELGRYEEAYAELTRALAEDEGSAEIHAALGAAAGALGRTQEALQHNRAALGLDPQQLSAANNLAWTLATHPSDAIRDAEEAIRIAERAVALTQRQVADPLDTLAAAYAAAQRFEDAVGAEVDAIRMANLADETRKAEGFQARLRLYRAERAYVDGEPASAVEAALPASDLQGAVLILLDTVRADHLSAYGYARPTSPVLEALAKRGVLFEQAISSAPWTLPAVAALLAGDVSARTYDAEHRQLEHSAVESLVRAGYTTAAFTEGGFVSRHFGLDRGFLEFSEEEGAVQLLSGDERRGSGRGGSIQKTFAAAGAWLAKHRDERFFLLVHTYEPHTPYTRRRFAQGLDPGRFGTRFTLSDVRALQSGEIEPTPAELRYIEALYDGGLFASDRQIGVLLEQMDRLGLADRTLVVVTSDHGEELGEHFPERTGDHGHALHDSQVRVPLILANPRERYPLRRVAAQVRSIDVLPTVAALLGVHVGDERTGRDLTPLMRGRREPERSAFGGFTKAGPNRAFLRSGGFKYIESTGGEARQPMRTPPPDRQLYALQADPGEQRNLAAEQPERLAVWHESLRRAREASGHGATATGAGAVPDALRERLRSLGYSE